MQARARDLHRAFHALNPAATGCLHTDVPGAAASARALMLQAGFAENGHSWEMRITLDEAPTAAPAWPAGVTVRSFVPGQDEAATHALINETFADMAAYQPESLENWAGRLMTLSNFDPGLWLLAEAPGGGALAGAALCYDYGDAGWVAQLGVRRPFRRQGLGLALLQHAFGEFYRRGQRVVELGVDASNPTGATRLYERAGMHVARRYARFFKSLS
jgi:ribosomal protein S18 acetylase RimI-like enzyme